MIPIQDKGKGSMEKEDWNDIANGRDESRQLFEFVNSVKHPPGYLESVIIKYKGVIQFSSYTYEEDKFSCDYVEGVFIEDCENVEWLKPIQSSLKEETDILEELGEKEVMIQSFDKVRQLFEMRSWIMDGRGSYPYNDDRYKEEVRYLYEEFDALRKEVWKNIKTKTFEYREKIIADYQSSLTPKSIRDSDAVEFWEWHFKELRAGKLDLIKDKENGQTMWFYNSGKLPLLRLSTQELYAIFNEKSASLKPNKLSDGVNYNLRDSVQWNADKRSEKDLHYFKLFDGAHDEDCLLDHS